jgi:hypothetical protein
MRRRKLRRRQCQFFGFKCITREVQYALMLSGNFFYAHMQSVNGRRMSRPKSFVHLMLVLRSRRAFDILLSVGTIRVVPGGTTHRIQVSYLTVRACVYIMTLDAMVLALLKELSNIQIHACTTKFATTTLSVLGAMMRIVFPNIVYPDTAIRWVNWVPLSKISQLFVV